MRSVGRLGPRKSYSYRYTIGAVNGPPGGPQPGCTIIETRYRGRTASWRVDAFRAGGDSWDVDGTFVEPRADNPLAYPAGALARAAVSGVASTPPASAAPVNAAPLPVVATVAETFAPSSGDPLPLLPLPPVAPRAARPRTTAVVEPVSSSDQALVAFQRALQVGDFDPVVS